ncbi:MarR family winged helix-turn-helix transcriptional regulator [Dokdonella fugitiva]|jgi:DNA-binding MarR family transcriptional regulator|uniref:MarR family protein n=1 Tax=Dokdonella fugitiva TaxID=328517 RepID=A0A4R2I7F5_9GAMM|nr:MarR family winged helix-turn-helix transcriptional regulator [Dokdonella fugitiva]MBA8884392.1 DNA-binding MarR family transcriptional regulator [Dokdonella fugitiva]TCO39997.1 MarR family protein [Dokdonella fugitiva]
MNDFIQAQGTAFLAHLLRRLADELVQGAAEWYPTVGVNAPPRTLSTLVALDEHGPLGVTELAGRLRQSHPLVIVWIRELSRLSLVEQTDDPVDRRRTVVRLTAAGRREVVKARAALQVMAEASRGLLALAGSGTWDALWAMERGCRERPFVERLRAAAAKGEARASRKQAATAPRRRPAARAR